MTHDACYEKAHKLARAGFIPIPLDGKVPAVKGWQKLTEVTAADIDAWWGNGNNRNVGILTGHRGLLVLDFDGQAGYQSFVQKFGKDYADTMTVETGSGNGMHVYYIVEEMPKSTGQKSIPGGYVEIKAHGRQVVVPPSIHPDTGALYQTVNAKQPARLHDINPVLDWILEHNPAPQLERTEATPPPDSDNDRHRKYALAALEGQRAMLAGTTAGGRNDALNTSAFVLAGFVAAGTLTQSEVRAALQDACMQNGLIADDGATAFEKTFNSGFRDGMGEPRYAPERRKEQRATLPGAPAYQAPTIQIEGGDEIESPDVINIGRTKLIKRSSMFSDLLNRVLDLDYTPGVPPVIFPLRSMHFLGGLARITTSGKVMAFVGSSGSGKTSALETLADAYVADGVPVMLWSPEWSPEEFAERALQRHGGPTQDALYLHDMAKWRAKQGRDYNFRDFLTDAQQQAASLAIRHMRGWETEVTFMQNTLMTVQEMAEVIAAARSIYKPEHMPRVLICDYAQLLKANEADQDDSSMYNMVQRFKALCVYYGLIGIMATQTLKSEARENINDGDFLGTTVFNCTKNSRGKKGKVRLESDPARLRIIDRAHHNQAFDDSAHYLGSQAGRWINDDAFNLWVTINPEYSKVSLSDLDN